MKFLRVLPLLLVAAAFLFVGEVEAKDQWIEVRSKNFFLIGNASEKEIRRVGTRLEQFRETFRLLFRNARLTSAIPTNVVVFKSDSAYRPFKPKRADGKTDDFIAGYFQPGEDVNYITLSTGGEEKDVFGTIFHEYVHFVVDTNFGKSEVPAWFNEGLAEYYQMFEIEDDIEVKLGLPQSGHLQLLQQNKLMPLETLFGISNRQLLQSGGHSRSIFYAQSWALVHYFMQSDKSDQLNSFLSLIVKGTPPSKAFQDAFQADYAVVEKDLRKYVEKSSYQYNRVQFKNKLTFDTEMTATPMSDAASSAYLGDLLYHTNRPDDAEPFLLNALRADPNSSMANTTLGMVKLKQRKFDEARALLEKAIAGDPKNHIAYYRYAYLLSREGQDEFGFAREFQPASVAKMREALKKAIAINPTFTESYEMLAFIAVVTNDGLDEAVAGLRAALSHQPGNQRYALRIAEIFMRQDKLADARAVAEKIARTTDDNEVKQRADSLLSSITARADFEAMKKRYESGDTSGGTGSSGPPRLLKGARNGRSDAEIDKLRAESQIRSINEILREPASGEQRLVGRIQKIDCNTRPLVYTVASGSDKFTVTSTDFSGLTLGLFDIELGDAQVGCDSDVSAYDAVITYRTAPGKAGSRGDLVAIEFVPANFKLMTASEIATARQSPSGQPAIIVEDSVPVTDGQQPPRDFAAEQRRSIIESMRNALRKPAAGEKREMGFLEKVECSGSKVYFHVKTSVGSLKLLNSKPESLRLIYFTQDLAGMQVGCGMKAVEYPAVVVFTDKPDTKAKSVGEILSLEFVPKSFTLEP